MKHFVIFILGIMIGIAILGKLQDYKLKKTKPISYPEEIEIAKAGDTLIVYSIKDSIYVKFKNK